MKNSEIEDLVDFIAENLPGKKLAQLLSQNQDEEVFRVVDENFITSRSKKHGFVRIIRDIKMTSDYKFSDQQNTCRIIYRYEIYDNDILNYSKKFIFGY